MKSKIFIYTFIFIFITSLTLGQTGVINNGAKMIISSGAYLDIDDETPGDLKADYVNESYTTLNGRLDLDGTIKLEGDFVHDANGDNVLINHDGTGVIKFDGSSGTQTIGGTAVDSILMEGLTIESGATVHLLENKDLTLSGNMSNAGSFVIKSSATGTGSFIDNGTIGGAGSFEAQLYLADDDRYYYISPPIDDATSDGDLVDNTGLYQYNTASSAWAAIASPTTLTAGRGYAVKYGTTGNTVQFTGTLNTGSIGLAVGDAGNNWWLVGNPYPSTINWETVTRTNVDPTMWYRTTHTSNFSRIFETYNAASHEGTDNNEDTFDATQYIQGMQAFWVKVTGSPTLTVANLDRSHVDQLYYKNSKSTNTKLRLKVNYEDYSDEAMIYFFSEATAGLDDYDSRKRFATDAIIPQLYTEILEDTELVFNGLPRFDKDISVHLGFKTEMPGEFTIAATEIENFPRGTDIYLEDTHLDLMINLKSEGSYTFTSDPYYSNERFIVHFQPEMAVIDDFSTEGSGDGATGISEQLADFNVSVYTHQNFVYVKCNDPENLDAQLSIVNMLGQEMYRKELEKKSLNRIQFNGNNANYLVRILSNNGYYAKKVYIE
jgi:hypothetical protein